MGSFRNKQMDQVREMKENSHEATDLGNDMQQQADQINRILDSLHLQDDEDVSEVSATKNAYQQSFDTAFAEEVESMGAEIGKQGEQLQDTLGAEQVQVRQAIQGMEQSRSLSEIGHEAADASARKLEQSDRTYDAIGTDAGQTVEGTTISIEQLKNRVNRIFG